MFKHFLARRALQKLPTVNPQSLFPLVVLYKNCKRSILKTFPARRALQEKHMVNFQHLPRPQVLRRTSNRVFSKQSPRRALQNQTIHAVQELTGTLNLKTVSLFDVICCQRGQSLVKASIIEHVNFTSW